MSDRCAYVAACLLCLPCLPLRLLFVVPFWTVLFIALRGRPRSQGEAREYVHALAYEVRCRLGLPPRWLYDDARRRRRMAEYAREARTALRETANHALERVARHLVPPGVAARVSLLTSAGSLELPLAEITHGPAESAGAVVHSLDWPLCQDGERVGILRCSLFAPSVSRHSPPHIVADAIGTCFIRQDEWLWSTLSRLSGLVVLGKYLQAIAELRRPDHVPLERVRPVTRTLA